MQTNIQPIKSNQYYNKKCIQQRRYEIQLQNTDRFKPEFINSILPMYNKSFILVQNNNLIHVSSDGIILNQLKLQAQILGAQAITSKIVLLYSLSNSDNLMYLLQWNLLTNSTITIELPRHHKQSQAKLLIFSQSKLACISEIAWQCNKNHNLQRCYLSYFKYPIHSPKDNPIHIFSSEKQLNISSSQLQKLNNKSMVGWFNSLPTICPISQIRIYNPQEKCNEKYKQYKFLNPENLSQNQYQKILNIWQIKQGIVHLKLQTKSIKQICKKIPKNKFLFESQNQDTLIQQIQNQKKLAQQVSKYYSYIWEYKSGKIYPANFQISNTYQIQFINQFRSLDTSPILRSLRQQQLYQKYNSQYDNHNDMKQIMYAIAFVEISENTHKLICVQKQKKLTNTWIPEYKKKICVPIYDPKSYYNYNFEFRYEDASYQCGQFQEWPIEQKLPQEQEQQIFQEEIKNYIEQKYKKVEKNRYQRPNLKIFLQISHKKIRYFPYSNQQVAVWALSYLIEDCNYNLLDHVCSLFDN